MRTLLIAVAELVLAYLVLSVWAWCWAGRRADDEREAWAKRRALLMVNEDAKR